MAYSKQMLRVLKARERVANKDRWFADVIYNLPIKEEPGIRTMDTNGVCIRFNPSFVDKIDAEGEDLVEGTFCHEGWHPILDHIARRGTREPRDWNIAADAIVNPIVRRRGWPLPKGAVFIKEVEAGRMSAERAYEYIKSKRAEAEKKRREKQEQQDGEEEENEEDKVQGDIQDQDTTEEPEEDDEQEVGGGEDDGDGDSDDTNDDGGEDLSDLTDDVPEEGSERMQEPTQEELDEFRQKINRAIQSATNKAVSEGRMDPVIAKALDIDKTEAPPLNWQEILQEMVETNRNQEARTWARPNRRYLGQGDIRPGYLRDQINKLIVLYDTSGSVNEAANVQMKKVTADLLEKHTITSILMISVDTQIQAMGEVFSPQEVLDFDLNIHHGGTNFGEAMREVGQIEDKVGVVFLTDMQTSDFGPDPMVPVVWVNWGREVNPGQSYWPPYGRVVKYEGSANG